MSKEMRSLEIVDRNPDPLTLKYCNKVSRAVTAIKEMGRAYAEEFKKDNGYYPRYLEIWDYIMKNSAEKSFAGSDISQQIIKQLDADIEGKIKLAAWNAEQITKGKKPIKIGPFKPIPPEKHSNIIIPMRPSYINKEKRIIYLPCSKEVRNLLDNKRPVIPIPANIHDLNSIKQVRIVYSYSGRCYKYQFCVEEEDSYIDDIMRIYLRASKLVNDYPKIARKIEAFNRDFPIERYSREIYIDPGQSNLLTLIVVAVDRQSCDNFVEMKDIPDDEDKRVEQPVIVIPMDSYIFPASDILASKQLAHKNAAEYQRQYEVFEDYIEQVRGTENAVKHPIRKLNNIRAAQRRVWEASNREVDWMVKNLACSVIALALLLHASGIGFSHNKGQKNRMRLGKRTNQKFVHTPWGAIRYWLERWCIRLRMAYVETEESYTSKSSNFENDVLPKYDPDNTTKYAFKGHRKKRGLYVLSDKLTCINADTNGALGACRKCRPGAVVEMDLMTVEGLEGVVNHPMRISGYLPDSRLAARHRDGACKKQKKRQGVTDYLKKYNVPESSESRQTQSTDNVEPNPCSLKSQDQKS